MFTAAALFIKLLLNYKGRGRGYYFREIIRPIVWFFVKRKHKDEKSITIKRNGITWILPMADDVISSSIFIHRQFNKSQVDKILWYAKSNDRLSGMISGDKTLIDIGANYGTASILFARRNMFNEIHAIEPDPDNYVVLLENIHANDLGAVVKTHNYALSDINGFIDFELSKENKGDHRVLPGTVNKSINLYKENERERIKVPCMKLDDFLYNNKLDIMKIGLIWVDVQGHEGHVFAQSEILKKNPVPIFAELWPYGLMRSGGLNLFVTFIKENYAYFIQLESKSPEPESTRTIDNLVKKLGTRGRMTEILLYS